MNDQQLAAERTAFEEWFLLNSTFPPTEKGNAHIAFLAGFQAALAQRESMTKGEVAEIIKRLADLHASKKATGGVHGQVIGMEPYVLKACGADFEVMLDACYTLQRTEAARLEVVNNYDAATLRANANAEQFKTVSAQLTAERARSEKLVEALGDMLSWAYRNFEWGCTPMEIVKATAAQRAYQSSKENGE